MDEAEFRRDTFLPLRGDARDRYSEEMNRVISEKALQGQNGLIREKYITISLHEDDYRKAQVRLLKRAEDIQNLFKRMGSTVRRLSGIERLNLLHGITRPEEVMAFSYDWLLAEDSITTKDFIAPSGYNWKPEHDDSRAVYNERYQFGEYYGKVLYITLSLMVGKPAICCFVAIEKRHIAAALLLCPEDGARGLFSYLLCFFLLATTAVPMAALPLTSIRTTSKAGLLVSPVCGMVY